MRPDKFRKKTLGVAVTSCLVLAGFSLPVQAEPVNYTATHVFTIDDIQGGFSGTIFGPTAGAGTVDPTILCGITSACPPLANQPFVESKGSLTGVQMYPIDSEFGFLVSDYVGAAQKTRDNDYMEGWAGNVPITNLPPGEDPLNYPSVEHSEGGTVIGLALANEATSTYKVNYPWGRWCTGAGGSSVKCETEHYVVMENIRSCYETVPYFYANPNPFGTDVALERDAAQGNLYDPETGAYVDTCKLGQLDNVLYEVDNGLLTNIELGTVLDPDEGYYVPDMEANESSARHDIAAGKDYGMTKKDDGKPLYRFGNMDKRPNDIRFYARIPLPDEWKVPGASYDVTKAKLIIRHLITNNPNDQVRSEDMENEGAIGRKPSYSEVGSQWHSAVNCYEGDGDYIPAGTVLKNGFYAYNELTATLPSDLRSFGTLVNDRSDDVNGVPYPYSVDLREGLTAGWFTTTDREPFEWAYDSNGDGIVDFSTPIEGEVGVDIAETDALVSGPRWRLRPNKFGQDLPGLEVPTINCMPTPYTSEFVKYPVLQPTVMEHNLLDFAGPSPLLTSNGWVDHHANFQNEEGELVADISVNGAPLTEDLDVAIYVKGDRKTVAIYNATVEIEYDSDATIETFDFAIEGLSAPESATVGTTVQVTAQVSNTGNVAASGDLQIEGYTSGRSGQIITTCGTSVVDLPPDGVAVPFGVDCDIPEVLINTMYWRARLVAPGDIDLSNNVYQGGVKTSLLQPVP